MAVLGQGHLSLIIVCMSLAEVGDSAGVTSGQSGGPAEQVALAPHRLPLSVLPCPWGQPGTGSSAPDS